MHIWHDLSLNYHGKKSIIDSPLFILAFAHLNFLFLFVSVVFLLFLVHDANDIMRNTDIHTWHDLVMSRQKPASLTVHPVFWLLFIYIYLFFFLSFFFKNESILSFALNI